MNPKILLVDDEEHVLSGYRRNLRSHFKIYIASSGKAGLELIEKEGPFSVVVSDFKMPEMNGNQFLHKVKKIAPETVRIMLTGFADLQTTIDAVNDGNIFRLLTKPCPTERLLTSLNDAVKQYNLINAEKILLDQTLKGSIKVLIDILASVNPTAFSRTSRFQKYIPQICSLLNIQNVWELEVAVLLSQIGLVVFPSEILERKFRGETLEENLEDLFYSHPDVGKSLLLNIPHLDTVAKVISYQFNSYSDSYKNTDGIIGEKIPLNSRILRVLNDFDSFVSQGFSFTESFEKVKQNNIDYDPNVIIALDAALAGIYDNLKLYTVNIEDVQIGVVAAADIVDKNGLVLVTRGSEITNLLKMKLLNYCKYGNMRKEIKILK